MEQMYLICNFISYNVTILQHIISRRVLRVLIWIAEGAIQIKLPSSYRWKLAPLGAEYLA